MAVTRDDVRKIAALAELEVSDEAAVELERQLSRILDYVAQLGQLPREAPAAAGAAGAQDERAVRLRRDEVAPDVLREPPSAFAPALRQGLFVVPKLGDAERVEDAP